jgi:hypothetical protein
MKNGRRYRILGGLFLGALASLSSGCFKLQYTVALNAEDGGAIVTERLRLSETMRSLDAAVPEKERLDRFLQRDAVLERMKSMGKDIALKEHKVTEMPGGDLESVAVFTIPQVAHLRLVNPFIDVNMPRSMMSLHMWPEPKKGRRLQNMVHIQARIVEKSAPPPPAAGGTPADRQVFRDLVPAMAHMLSELDLCVRVRLPVAVREGHERGAGHGAQLYTVFALSGRNMVGDAPFFEHEEAMLALLRGDLQSGSILGLIRGGSGWSVPPFVNDGRLPVWRCAGVSTRSILIDPTPHMNRAWFEKKEK